MGNVSFHWPHEGWAQVFAPRYVKSVGMQLLNTALPKESHSASNLLSLPFHTPWGTVTFLWLFSSSWLLSSSPKTFSGQTASGWSHCFFVFHRTSLGGMSWLFHPPRQGKGNLKLAGTDLKTPFSTTNYPIPPWNQEPKCHALSPGFCVFPI